MYVGLQVLQKEVGKLTREMAAAAGNLVDTHQSPRLFMKDILSLIVYLIDCGSDVSALPKKYCQRLDNEIEYSLQSVNGQTIKVYGIKTITIDLGFGKKFVWNVIVADIQSPILGADFLKHFDLLPDLARSRLIHNPSLISVEGVKKSTAQASIHLISLEHANNNVKNLFEQHPNLQKPPRYQEKPLHDTVHYISTTGKPVAQRPYRLPQCDLEEIKKDFQEMTRVGIMQPSSSPWAAPIVIVRKHGKKRYCGNYRRLNSITVPDRYSVPNISDCANKLHGKTIFSRIDLVKAYFNIPVHQPHVKKTAVISPIALYEYLRMPFGLKNSPSTWARFINSILGDLPFIFIYFDDILIFSESETQHLEYLKILFQRLDQYGLTINVKKSKFLVHEINFLSYRILQSGLQPTEERIKFIRELQPPKTVAALRRVLGTFSFYCKFVKNAAHYLAPLYGLLKGKKGKRDRTVINWTQDLVQVFQKARSAFINYTLLNFMKDDCPLQLVCDASGSSVGGVLQQIVNGEPQPIAFHSEKLDEKKVLWSTYDKELYSIYTCVLNLEYLIQGRDVELVTDHKPLLSMFHSKSRIKLERRSRQIEFISQFSTKIKHVSGESNIVADAMSRIEAVELQQPISLKDIAEALEQDSDSQELRKNSSEKCEVRDVFFPNENVSVLCVKMLGKQRIIVPKKYRRAVFDQLHGIHHPAGRPTIKLISNSYYWPNMQSEIRKWCRCCLACQVSKVVRHTKSRLGNFPPSDRCEHVHTDIVTLPEIDGYRYVITFIDRATRWIEAKPLKSTQAEDVAQAFVDVWVSRHGVPLKLSSDRGPQFRSKLFDEVCKLLGVDTVKTTSYNPKANGIVERVQKTLKNGLKCRNNSWMRDLPFVLLGLRTAIKEDTNISPAEMMYGRTLRVPGEFYAASNEINDEYTYVKELRDAMSKLKSIPFKSKNNQSIFVHPDLMTAKKVFVRVDKVKQPLEAPYQGPYEVLKRNKKYFLLQLREGPDNVSIDRLKPAYELIDDIPQTQASKSILKKVNFQVSQPQQGSNSVSNTRVNTNLNRSIPLYKIHQYEQPQLLPQMLPSPQPMCSRSLPPQSQHSQSTKSLLVTSRGRKILKPVRFRE